MPMPPQPLGQAGNGDQGGSLWPWVGGAALALWGLSAIGASQRIEEQRRREELAMRHWLRLDN